MEKFRRLLENEFAVDFNSAELHELLNRRVKKDTESMTEYYFSMRQLASRGNIEDAALIQYIINGINDRQENKLILYGCKNLIEFKDKLKVYEKIKSDMARSKNNFDKSKPKQKYENCVERKGSFNPNYNANQSIKHCFNCGGKGHLSRTCMHKNRGLKCFQCQNFGHKASECPKSNSKPKVTSNVQSLNISTHPNLNKIIEIGELKINSMIDTGSQVTIISENVYNKLNINELHPSNSTLSGFGKSITKPLGFFKSEIKIDEFKCFSDICVVENNNMPYDVIIGLDVLMQGETVINEKGISIKNKPQPTDDINIFSILPVNLVTTDDVIVNIEPDVPNILKDEVQQLISSYVPNKTKSTNIELNILLKSDAPISHQPRRLPFSEKRSSKIKLANG